MTQMIYLASPYSHPDPSVRVARFHAACKAAADLMVKGHVVFSPIAHSHPIAMAGDLPLGWEYWEAFDRQMLSICSGVFVLQLPGWEESKGLKAELALAEEMGIPVVYLP